MAVSLDRAQSAAVSQAVQAQSLRDRGERELGKAVVWALARGVPLNTLATALGVSRSRVRRLARVEKSAD